jgi:hypothetical protein
MVAIRYVQKHGTKNRPWLGRLMERRPTKVAAVALANKIADGLGHHGAWRQIPRAEAVGVHFGCDGACRRHQ